jgi:hypothetical protein
LGRARIAAFTRNEARRPGRARNLAASVLRENRFVLTLALAYVVFGGIVLRYVHQQWPLRFATAPFTVIWLAGTALWLLAAYLASPNRLRACLRAERVAGALLVALVAVPVQITFQSLKQAIGAVIGFRLDPPLDRLDHLIHGGPAFRWFGGLIANAAAIRTLDTLYMLWFVEIVVVVVWASWTPHRAARQRALVAMLLLWIVAGTIGAALTASAGPCYVATPDYEQLLRRLDAYAPPLWARINQRGIWKLYQDQAWGSLAGVSAMPSMHVAFATLAACIAWTRGRSLGVVAATYAVAIQVGSVALGWHYGIDGYAGALSGLGCWYFAGTLNRIREADPSGPNRSHR